MNRAEKIAFVERLTQKLEASPHVILAGFRGLSVNQANELRRKVEQAGGGYQVIKNRLAKLAVQGTPSEPLHAQFEGPCALATHGSLRPQGFEVRECELISGARR